METARAVRDLPGPSLSPRLTGDQAAAISVTAGPRAPRQPEPGASPAGPAPRARRNWPAPAPRRPGAHRVAAHAHLCGLGQPLRLGAALPVERLDPRAQHVIGREALP